MLACCTSAEAVAAADEVVNRDGMAAVTGAQANYQLIWTREKKGKFFFSASLNGVS